MNRRGSGIRSALARAVAALTLMCMVAGSLPPAARAETTPPAVGDVRTACTLSAGYMRRAVGADGRFVYEIDMRTGAKTGSYNILRHGGSVWAMTDYYRSRPSSDLRAAILRSGAFLRDKRLRIVGGRTDLLAIWSLTEDDGDSPAAKLGGTGLGLVALTSVEGIQPGFTSKARLRAMGRFLLYMQKTDGSFYTQYVPSRGGRVSTPPSLYYPGEAALGLLMLYEVDPQPVWAQGAIKALSYLAKSRAGDEDVPADHWALIATEKLKRLTSRLEAQGVVIPKTALTNHAVQISEEILASQRADGSYTSSGSTASAATRLEGLQASLRILSSTHPLRPQIQASVNKGIAYLLRNQVKTGTYSGAFAEVPGSTMVRIDYVQHSLSAMLRYVRLNS